MMPMNSVEQKTAKRLQGIVNETVKKSLHESANGDKTIGSDPVKCRVSGETEKLQMGLLKKSLKFGGKNGKKPSAIKTSCVKMFLRLTEVSAAIVAVKLSECFCQLTMCITMAQKKENPGFTNQVAPDFICGFGKADSLKGIKCFA